MSLYLLLKGNYLLQTMGTILILGWCILLLSCFNENHKSIAFVSNLSCLYCTQITLHVSVYGHPQVYHVYKNAKIIIKHNGSVNLLSNLTIITITIITVLANNFYTYIYSFSIQDLNYS
jgi:hypothetical protein